MGGRDGVVGTSARVGVEGRGGSSGRSNGGTDLLTPFFHHKQYRVLELDVARAELEALMASDERLAGMFDFTDKAAPAVVRACRKCKEPQRMTLVVEEGPHAGRVIVSPLILRFLGLLICEECEAAELEELAVTQRANDYAARLQASGISAAMEREVRDGWGDIIVRGRSADDGAKRVQVRDYARAWSEDPDPGARGLWLHGGAGSGKTRLVATAAVARLKLLQVRWVSVAVLVTHLEGAWADEDRLAALKVLTSPDVVVLDDLDKVTPSPKIAHAMFTALEARDQAKVGICVTSNLPPSEIAKTWSTPFMSRLVKLANPMQYPGPDKRLEMVS
jgi:DNA replication protein DnaC